MPSVRPFGVSVELAAGAACTGATPDGPACSDAANPVEAAGATEAGGVKVDGCEKAGDGPNDVDPDPD